MKKFIISLVLSLFGMTAMAADLVYEGTWVTTKNRKLDGTMTCIATDVGNEQWKGRFFGEWQGSKFSYNVTWTGSPDKLRGKATVDGVEYDWTGEMGAQTPGWFNGTFTSGRYTGYFKLKEKR